MYPQFLTLILFGIVTSFTPGPNNIMASHSGFNFGFKKTAPLMLGVTFVVTLIILLISNRSFGGVTGDILGSTNELTRLASLMVFVSL